MMEVKNARKPTLYLDVVMQSLTYVGMVTRREKGAVYAGAYSLLYGAWTSFLVEYVMFKLNEIRGRERKWKVTILLLNSLVKGKGHFRGIDIHTEDHVTLPQIKKQLKEELYDYFSVPDAEKLRPVLKSFGLILNNYWYNAERTKLRECMKVRHNICHRGHRTTRVKLDSFINLILDLRRKLP